MKQLLGAMGIAASMAAAGQAGAVGITMTGAYLDVIARGDAFTTEFVETVPTIPLNTTDTIVSLDGTSTTSATYGFSNSAAAADLDFDFDMALTGGLHASVAGALQFTLTETVDFAISGSMTGTAKDVRDEFRYFVRFASLTAAPTGDILNEVDTVVGTSTNSVLGDGIFDSGNNGPTAGSLAPGDYLILYGIGAHDNIAGFGGAIDGEMNATAALSLRLTSQTVAVPEPATLTLFGLGLLGLGAARRRRKQARSTTG